MKCNVLFVAGYLESDGITNYTMPFIDRQLDSLNSNGLTVYPFSIQSHKSRLNYIFKAPQIRAEVQEKKIDIIHAHYSYAAFTCGLSTTTPLVVSLMGEDTYGRVGKGFKTRLINLISKQIITRCSPQWDAIIVKSAGMKALIRHPHTYVIPNGVDFYSFRPMDRSWAQDQLHLSRNKKYILFGGDPDNPRKNYPLSQKVLGLVQKKLSNVTMIPLKDIAHKDVPLYLNACSCLLLTSLKEGSPNIVKESLACNIPVVSVDVGDVTEQVSKLPRCSANPYDPHILADKVLQVLNDQTPFDIRSKISQLNIHNVARDIIKVYSNVLHAKDAPRQRRYYGKHTYLRNWLRQHRYKGLQ